MDIEAMELALTDAIEQWMKVPREHMDYHHGKSQGIAIALAAGRHTTFTEEWVAGLDRYQNRVVLGTC